MKYNVYQTFETLGEPTPVLYDTEADAQIGAAQMMEDIMDYVLAYASPCSEKPMHPTGFSDELAAWDEADRMLGVTYDETGRITDDSPDRYTPETALFIARRAVRIERLETD